MSTSSAKMASLSRARCTRCSRSICRSGRSAGGRDASCVPPAPEVAVYPYPELEPLLRLRATPAQYLQATAPIRSQGGSLLLSNPAPAYWELLDLYRFAVCPFGCGGYQSKL